jgi:ABC-2 type transport system ATP-binding protein
MQQKFFGLIREENANGATVLFSSHILPEVQKLCTRVAIIKEGRIIRVEDIGTMRDTTYKKIRIDYKSGKAEAITALDGVNDFKQDGCEISFLYKGDINRVIAVIGAFELNNLIIEEPDLEEIFLHYYG